MLTNKDVIESLINVGYTMEELTAVTNISIKTLNKMKKNEEVDEDSENQINHFFRMNMQEVDVSNFSDEEFRKTHLIMTPNGFKKVLDYKDEGLQHCFKVSLKDFSVIGSDKHQIQLTNNKWVTVSKIKEKNKVKVFDEQDKVQKVTEIGDINCCSITVDGEEFYLDGLVVK